MTAICENCATEFEQPLVEKNGKMRPAWRRTCSRSCAVALSWKNDGEKRRASISAAHSTPEAAQRLADFNARRWSRPGERERLSDWNRARWADPAIKQHLTEAIAANHRTPQMRQLYSRLRAEMWKNPELRARTIAGIRASKGTPKARAKFAMLLKARWNDPILRPKYLAAVRRTAAAMKGRSRSQPSLPLVHIPFLSFTQEEKKDLARRLFTVLRAARKNKSSIAELRDIVGSYKGPIKKLPMAPHA